MNRAQRRRAERSKDIPPDVRRAIQNVKNGGRMPKPDDPTLEATTVPPTDAAPFTMEELPPEMRALVEEKIAGAAGPPATAAAGKRNAKFLVLEMELTIYLAKLPAGAMRRAEDEFCVEHFEREGPAFASNLVRYAESNSKFYRQLRKMLDQMGIVMLGIGAVTYALPPILHHVGGPQPLMRMFGIPEKPDGHDQWVQEMNQEFADDEYSQVAE